MQSIQNIYKIGPGPSSSHTFGPMRASQDMLEHYSDADEFKVTLFGSLALTGKGHLTDKIIEKTFFPTHCTITFDLKTQCEHPNTMTIEAFKDHDALGKHTYISIGGGKILKDQEQESEETHVYPHNSMDDIQGYCKQHHLRLDKYIDQFEDESLNSYMDKIFDAMIECVDKGLNTIGKLPGSLEIDRVASALYQSANSCDDLIERKSLLLSSYAYAASEQNASGGMVVTAPTMGSCGVLPSLLYHFYKDENYPKDTLIQGLKVAGLIGNLIQHNATISGAKAGCQAEVGAACSMGAAFVSSCNFENNAQIECAAEIGLEHHLGLTCDPVGGYVMIPCIERNAVASLRSLDAARLAKYLRNVKKNRVSFDMVVKTMNLTGSKLPLELKESALGGLAVVVPTKKNG
ncbi:L-serine ammonia-lyase, iron-sulfur-dependent, subunit alpha [Faecalicoccus pleomorphus]|uniref:L-serine ammonia-lyase, iron-sulfur-dependent, subunit alpha n=1 Tax=Faecalicoccus pleomorphus TaxID=1323 RepID=UPI0019609734|nr:L-serine ammonia-lyase, iron-sulfur-dependent, subunit alpha [Faecalicoccus pleomorphus]MBM6808593.1 L-serine ammonia-lyase, iron-sulfur-dependent, subunit alpha [Faecalicoccus pleomorphus]MDB7986429.1 L-serine ammonia-lyase, iron-sulfur-dependent, subunit alpha [Faecalicoccus pleomorphus]MDB7990123.1 L-serine ammonia-lyase, iron-sulfur-dependent, subunit alpha [Faecalicoccus pleomorphus]